MLSTVIESSVFNTTEKKWTMKIRRVDSTVTKTIVCKHFVQATGLGSGKPYLPSIQDKHLYNGVSIHSTEYRNAQVLADRGVKVNLPIVNAHRANHSSSPSLSSAPPTLPLTLCKTAMPPALQQQWWPAHQLTSFRTHMSWIPTVSVPMISSASMQRIGC